MSFPGKQHEPRKGSARSFRPARDKSYFAFYKPYGVLCQFTQPPDSDKRTLAEFGFPPNVYSVGRLDFDSEGLLILSDDVRLNQALLAPANRHDRVYLAQVENVPAEQQLAHLSFGVMLDGERTMPAKADLLPGEPSLPERPVPIRTRKSIATAWVKLALNEGKNRQVRRMTAAVGCPTLRLVRVAIGRINLFALALQPGEWLKLSTDDVGRLFEPADDKIKIPGIHN